MRGGLTEVVGQTPINSRVEGSSAEGGINSRSGGPGSRRPRTGDERTSIMTFHIVQELTTKGHIWL